MYEDMSKLVNVLLAIALLFMMTLGLVVNIATPVAYIWVLGMVICTLVALVITVGKTIGVVKDDR